MTLQDQIKPVLLSICLCVLFSAGASAETITVPTGGNLQAAINSAQSGDVIIIQANTTYTGDFVLPVKVGTEYITIQSSRAAELPEGLRVQPGRAELLARLQNVSTAEPIVKTAPGAHHYRFIGVEISTATPAKVFDLVRIGSPTQAAAEVPHDFIIDRSYIHGFPTQEVQRGISLNGAEVTVSNSYISEIHGTGYDTQALCGWNGPGPFHVINNYLEAAGENIMFGGALPSIAGLIPSSIEIRRNTIFKPLTWKVGHPTYAGIHWSVKNLLELKNARNVVIDSNVIENSWTDAQIGYAVLFTVRSEDGRAPWATVENIQFTNNVVKNSDQGFQLLGSDAPNPSGRGSGLLIANNEFLNIANRFLTISGFYSVTGEHNTHEQGGSILIFAGEKSNGFVWRNNVTVRNPNGFGVKGDGTEEGKPSLDMWAPGYLYAGNVTAGALERLYPIGNFFPIDLTGLASLKGTDGLVPGYNGPVQQPMQSPTPSPSPSPMVTPVPSPTPTPSPVPTVQPSPSPSPTVSPSPAPTKGRCKLWPPWKIANCF